MTRSRKIPAQAGLEPGIFRSRDAYLGRKSQRRTIGSERLQWKEANGNERAFGREGETNTFAFTAIIMMREEDGDIDWWTERHENTDLLYSLPTR